ncbi:MAG: hypothetical protein V1706_15410 [Pseudomonadota bacterium]
MHRELNEPEEIVRRLLFVVYLTCWCVAITSGVISLVQGRHDLLFLSAFSGGCAFFLRQHGEKSLQFKRLARSFPFDDPVIQVPAGLRDRAEKIFQHFHQAGDWQKRQELRCELAALIAENPALMQIYPREIQAVDPNLTDHSSA